MGFFDDDDVETIDSNSDSFVNSYGGFYDIDDECCLYIDLDN